MEDFRDRGVRALVLLHEKEMRSFLATWQRARERGVVPPACEDPNYVSLDALLSHVLRAGRGYLIWLCETLGLPDPAIRPAPTPELAAERAEDFAAHLFERWRAPLAVVEPGTLDGVEAKSRWGPTYSIDAMLEHAVMHPLRHAFQIEAWLANA